jgi:hypothetical protein
MTPMLYGKRNSLIEGLNDLSKILVFETQVGVDDHRVSI